MDFAKAKSFRADFLTFKTKETFIYLQKAFIKVLILYYFDMKRHICIKTDILRYAISKVLSQITSDQCFSNYVIHKDSDSFKSEIGV